MFSALETLFCTKLQEFDVLRDYLEQTFSQVTK